MLTSFSRAGFGRSWTGFQRRKLTGFRSLQREEVGRFLSASRRGQLLRFLKGIDRFRRELDSFWRDLRGQASNLLGLGAGCFQARFRRTGGSWSRDFGRVTKAILKGFERFSGLGGRNMMGFLGYYAG